jgi:hypothetical protein
LQDAKRTSITKKGNPDPRLRAECRSAQRALRGYAGGLHRGLSRDLNDFDGTWVQARNHHTTAAPRLAPRDPMTSVSQQRAVVTAA